MIGGVYYAKLKLKAGVLKKGLLRSREERVGGDKV